MQHPSFKAEDNKEASAPFANPRQNMICRGLKPAVAQLEPQVGITEIKAIGI
jgi:hypothetical protein